MGWQKIKNEYIAGEATLKELADKYDVSFSTIQKKSMEEGWNKLRKKKRRKTEEKIIDSISTKEAENAVNIIDVADKLLGKISKMIEGDKFLCSTQNVKHLTSALKDLMDVKGCKTEEDRREQMARIRKLEMECEKDSGKDLPTLEITGLPEEFKR